VFNKVDLLADPAAFAARVRELYPGAVMVTTMRTDGLNPLKVRLRDLTRANQMTVVVRVPLTDGAGLAALYREGEVLGVVQEGGAHEVTVRLDTWRAERLREQGREVEQLVETPRRKATG
jgi:50S ribosomal subunit-associated GTPase HflX